MRMNAMRKSTAIAAVALFGWLAAASAEATTIELVPLNSPQLVGGSFDVEIQLSGLGAGAAPSVKSFDLDVTFDPSVVSFLSITFATELGDPDTETIYGGSLAGVGVVDLFQVSLLAPLVLDGLQGSTVLLATLHFSADVFGTSDLDFSQTLVGDGAGAPLAPSPVSSSLEVIPEPSTALLVACGLLAIAGRRRPRA